MIIVLIFIFLAGIALARAEIALNGTGENKIDIATLAANYTNIKESLDRLESKMDRILKVER